MNNLRAEHAADIETGSVPGMVGGSIDVEDDANPSLGESYRATAEWLGFNLVLFVLYVGFFHLCLVTGFPVSLGIGLLIAAAMSFLCFRFYRLFASRYEFLFYLALPLDVFLEGLIPFHSGYSFYWCAAAFWLVFGLYRAYRQVIFPS